MPMRTTAIAIVLAAMAFLISDVFAQDEDYPELTVSKQPLEAAESLADVLRVHSFACSLEFTKPVSFVKLRLDIYQRGRRVDHIDTAGMALSESLADDKADLTVYLIDGDFLDTGDTKAGSITAITRLGVGSDGDSSTMRRTVDKKDFNVDKSYSWSIYRNHRPISTPDEADPLVEVPIFYVLGNEFEGDEGDSTSYGASDMNTTIEKNDDSHILIGVLEFK